MANIKIILTDPESFEESEKGDLAFKIDGYVQNTYHVHELPKDKRVLEKMLEEAYELGKKARSKEILKMLTS